MRSRLALDSAEASGTGKAMPKAITAKANANVLNMGRGIEIVSSTEAGVGRPGRRMVVAPTDIGIAMLAPKP